MSFFRRVMAGNSSPTSGTGDGAGGSGASGRRGRTSRRRRGAEPTPPPEGVRPSSPELPVARGREKVQTACLIGFDRFRNAVLPGSDSYPRAVVRSVSPSPSLSSSSSSSGAIQTDG
jgi:hypothetical protein